MLQSRQHARHHRRFQPSADSTWNVEEPKFKSLKRHLRTSFNMTPEEYRAKWGLNFDYPMVAPAYAAKRSELAKSMGLGSIGRNANKLKVVAKAAPAAKRSARKKTKAAKSTKG
jgi:hypothetical protein